MEEEQEQQQKQQAWNNEIQQTISGQEPLDIERIKKWIGNGADIHQVGNEKSERHTLLHVAAENGNFDCVELLIGRGGVDINPVGSTGDMPIHGAAVFGHAKVAGWLLRHGAKAEAPDNYGYTPLHCASEGGRLNVVNFMVEGYNVSVDAVTKKNQTPLYLACNEKHFDVAEFLLRHGADPCIHEETKDKELVPLLLAESLGDEKMIELLKRHAEMRMEIKEAIKEYLATCRDQLSVGKVEEWIRQGAYIDYVDDDNQSLLHVAAGGNNVACTRLLLERGRINVNRACISEGWTPLHLAASYGYLAIVQLLVENGANVDAQNHDGDTALFLTSEDGHDDIAKVLIEKGGANVDLANESGETPLWGACRCADDTDICRYLLEQGADPFVKDTKQGKTPLMVAEKDSKLVCLLRRSQQKIKQGRRQFEQALKEHKEQLEAKMSQLSQETKEFVTQKHAELLSYLGKEQNNVPPEQPKAEFKGTAVQSAEELKLVMEFVQQKVQSFTNPTAELEEFIKWVDILKELALVDKSGDLPTLPDLKKNAATAKCGDKRTVEGNPKTASQQHDETGDDLFARAQESLKRRRVELKNK